MRPKADPPEARIPEPGIRSAQARLEEPASSEGFDSIHTVTIDDQGRFQVREQGRKN